MKTLIFCSAFLLFIACNSENNELNKSRDTALLYNNIFESQNSQPFDTLCIQHKECTECLDAYVLSGSVSIPSNLTKYFPDSIVVRDLILTGKFPMNQIDVHSYGYYPEKKFIVVGKLISVDSSHSWSHAPIFYINKWDILKMP